MGTGEGLIRLSGGILLPDKLQYKVSLGPEGQTIDTNGVTIGADTYFQDPESMQWGKGAPPEDALLNVMQMVGLLYLPNDVPTTLGETVTLGLRRTPTRLTWCPSLPRSPVAAVWLSRHTTAIEPVFLFQAARGLSTAASHTCVRRRIVGHPEDVKSLRIARPPSRG